MTYIAAYSLLTPGSGASISLRRTAAVRWHRGSADRRSLQCPRSPSVGPSIVGWSVAERLLIGSW